MSESAPQFSVLIQNDSGIDIPPRSVVVVIYDEITAPTETNEAVLIVHVEQFSGQPGNILVTGPVTIPAAPDPVVDAEEETQEEEQDDGEESEVEAEVQDEEREVIEDEDELAQEDEAEDVPIGGGAVEEAEQSWWSADNSYGLAYSDQRIYVAIDQSIDLPTPGEEWGPVAGQWYITRGGRGFFADGYPQSPGGSGSGSGEGGGGDPANIDFGRAIFMRGTPFKKNWAKITSLLSPGTLESPTTCTVDVWLPDPNSTSNPRPYVVATDNALLGMTVTNRGCYEIDAPGGSSSGSGSRPASASSSANNSQITCRIEYDNDAGEWYLAWLGRCFPVVTSVSCSSSGLTVKYGSVTG